MIICSLVAFPLAISMITVGALSIDTCSKEADLTNTNSSTVLSDSTSNQTTGNFDKVHIGILRRPQNLKKSSCLVAFSENLNFSRIFVLYLNHLIDHYHHSISGKKPENFLVSFTFCLHQNRNKIRNFVFWKKYFSTVLLKLLTFSISVEYFILS